LPAASVRSHPRLKLFCICSPCVLLGRPPLIHFTAMIVTFRSAIGPISSDTTMRCTSKKGCHPCKIFGCRYRTKQASNIKIHMESGSHTTLWDFKCQFCFRNAKSPEGKVRHEDKCRFRFGCEEIDCPETYSTANALILHLQRHHKKSTGTMPRHTTRPSESAQRVYTTPGIPHATPQLFAAPPTTYETPQLPILGSPDLAQENILGVWNSDIQQLCIDPSLIFNISDAYVSSLHPSSPGFSGFFS